MDLNKTSVVITGVVCNHNRYEGKEGKVYHSLDLIVKGHSNMINVRVPSEPKSDKYPIGGTVQVPVQISISKYGTNINAVQ